MKSILNVEEIEKELYKEQKIIVGHIVDNFIFGVVLALLIFQIYSLFLIHNTLTFAVFYILQTIVIVMIFVVYLIKKLIFKQIDKEVKNEYI